MRCDYINGELSGTPSLVTSFWILGYELDTFNHFLLEILSKYENVTL